MNIIANQSLFDVAMKESGSALTLFDWAVKNNISPTALLVPGAELVKPDSIYTDIDRAAYFKNRQQALATAAVNIDFENAAAGIGYMAIELDFIIS